MMIPATHNHSAEQLDATFAALGDPTRRAILARLAQGDASVTELAEPFHMSQPAISKHLRVLERAGLVTRDGSSHRRPCHLHATPLQDASHWLEEYRALWEGQYQRLDALLEEMKAMAGIQTPPAVPPQPTTARHAAPLKKRRQPSRR